MPGVSWRGDQAGSGRRADGLMPVISNIRCSPALFNMRVKMVGNGELFVALAWYSVRIYPDGARIIDGRAWRSRS